ncbi:hypothetical protein GCM10028803_53160 [Larkinella knui]|uniref:DUF4848 domain-containing protein n=1 Tax=Larkinella knui TaxID=2025310 RepID=A0A3P1CH06_9BACT|nr:hypothetical protein [Larkinella knui]RRB12478.1 hypothetical protein EHT87_19965 [Larkinella knui]
MRKSIYNSLVIGILANFAITSCEKPERLEFEVIGNSTEQSIRKAAQSITVIDGRLKFATTEAFSQAVKELNSTTDLLSWEKQFAGYKSMRRAFKELNEEELATDPKKFNEAQKIAKRITEEDGVSFERTIVDATLATLVSSQGLLQIGDSLHLIGDQQVLSTLAVNEKELVKPSSALVKISPVVHKKTKITTDKGGRIRATTGDVDDKYDIYYNADGRQHRYRSNGWAIVYYFTGGYWSTGVNIQHQRKQTFGWGSSNAFDWTSSGFWKVYVDSPRSIIQDVTISPPLFSDIDEYQPYRYSESPVTSMVVNRYVNGQCNWQSRGRDGNPYYYAHYITTSL